MHPSRLFAFFLFLLFPFIVQAVPRSYSIVRKAAPNTPNAGYGVIDNTGKVILPCSYTEIRMDPAGYFRTKNAGVISLFDENGQLIFQSSAFMEIGNCGNGLVPVQDKTSQLWGYADLTGKLRIAAIYQEAKTFVCGLGVVHFPIVKEEKFPRPSQAPRIINLDGKVVLDFSRYPEVHKVNLHPFSDSLVSFIAEANAQMQYMEQADNEVQGFITMRGQLLTKNIFRTHAEFYATSSAVASMPFVCVLPGERYCYCASNGTVVIPGPFGRAHPFSSDGIAMVTDFTGTYFIDLHGKRLYEAAHYTLGERMPGGVNLHDTYENNRIPVYDAKKNQTYYIDTKGRVVISLDSGMKGMDFHEGFAPVWRYVDRETYSYEWSWIDTTGKIRGSFDTLRLMENIPQYFRNHPYIFVDAVSNKYGMRSADRNVLVSPEWDRITEGVGVFLVWGGATGSRGPASNYYSGSPSGALNEKGVLITKGYYSFSDFTSFTSQEKNLKVAALNFTEKEMGDQIIDVLEIRTSVEQGREFIKKRDEEKKKKQQEGEEGN
jgi:hypothetical protein